MNHINRWMKCTIVRLGVAVVLALTAVPAARSAQGQGRGMLSEKALEGGADAALAWESGSGQQVEIETPMLIAQIGRNEHPFALTLVSHSTQADQAFFEYRTTLSLNGKKYEGTYQVACSLSGDDEVLICKTKMDFSTPMDLDVVVQHLLSIRGEPGKSVVEPERTGIVRTYPIEHAPGTYFDLGQAVVRRETQLAMPVIGVDFSTRSLAVAVDPYIGTALRADPVERGDDVFTQISLKTIYRGRFMPSLPEERTIALQFHQDGIDGTLNTFYRTIPDIKPGPDWIHDIQLTFYEYIAETGTSFKPDLEALASRIPAEYRKHVIVCVHGYYDYLGRYSYNHNTKSFDDEWDAYDHNKNRLPMTKEKLHGLMRLVKSYGFRVGVYFGDALAYDDLNPDFNEDWILRDAEGVPVRWWYWQQRPDKRNKEKNYMMDPSNPEVQQWFLDYTAAYVKEFGKDLDALVWDETHCFTQGQTAMTPDGLVAVDRAMMKLVASVSRAVQSAWDTHPDLALLLSDNIKVAGLKHVPFCLVAHGTWQDSFCTPEAWPPGMIPNFRNCMYSCNWWPVGNRTWNRIAVERYGMPQGLTNGYGDNQGPSEMPEDLLNETIELFLERCKSGKDRTRYLLP